MHYSCSEFTVSSAIRFKGTLTSNKTYIIYKSIYFNYFLKIYIVNITLILYLLNMKKNVDLLENLILLNLLFFFRTKLIKKYEPYNIFLYIFWKIRKKSIFLREMICVINIEIYSCK